MVEANEPRLNVLPAKPTLSVFLKCAVIALDGKYGEYYVLPCGKDYSV